MDRFQEMSIFRAVVDAGSFTQAAERLGLSKAAVSRSITQLESRLGIRLLNRTTRRLSVTEEGQTFHARCASLLAELDEAEAEITVRSGQALGLLRVAAPLSFGVAHLAPLWGDFLARHPQLRLEVSLNDRVVDLVEEGFDLAIRIGRLTDSSLISRKLASTPLMLCASPRYLRRHGTPRQPQDLSAHDVLAYSLFASGNLWTLTKDSKTEQVRVAPRLTANNGDTCVQAALHHAGIVLQPHFLVQDALREGALVSVLKDWSAGELGIHAVYPGRAHVSPKVRLLIDELARRLPSRLQGKGTS
jgi:DNA-binding transcriptional LysR family regulator